MEFLPKIVNILATALNKPSTILAKALSIFLRGGLTIRETSDLKLSVKTVNGFKLLTILTKVHIQEAWWGPEQAPVLNNSVKFKSKLNVLNF